MAAYMAYQRGSGGGNQTWQLKRARHGIARAAA